MVRFPASRLCAGSTFRVVELRRYPASRIIEIGKTASHTIVKFASISAFPRKCHTLIPVLSLITWNAEYQSLFPVFIRFGHSKFVENSETQSASASRSIPNKTKGAPAANDWGAHLTLFLLFVFVEGDAVEVELLIYAACAANFEAVLDLLKCGVRRDVPDALKILQHRADIHTAD